MIVNFDILENGKFLVLIIGTKTLLLLGGGLKTAKFLTSTEFGIENGLEQELSAPW